eukprot:3453202-Rhodomonas_salina.1
MRCDGRGGQCPGGDQLIPVSGFWRPSKKAQRRARVVPTEQLELYPCPPRACGDAGTCREGRTGPVCGVCEQGPCPEPQGPFLFPRPRPRRLDLDIIPRRPRVSARAHCRSRRLLDGVRVVHQVHRQHGGCA